MDKLNTLEISNANQKRAKVSERTLQNILSYSKAVSRVEVDGEKVIVNKN